MAIPVTCPSCNTAFEVQDIHPCFRERLASVRRENAEGIFHLDRPAKALFRNYNRLAAGVSLDLYRQYLSKRIKRTDLFPVEDML